MTRPLVSVMMPFYNAKGTLPMALASLLCQTMEDWECICVDDGSTDDGGELVHMARDPRLRYIRFETNRGRGAARQCALESAQGKYFAMLDADDWYYPEKLARQVSVMETNADWQILSTMVAIIGQDDSLTAIRGRATVSDGVLGCRALHIGPLPFNHAACLYRGERARCCRYDLKLARSQDLDFILQFGPGTKYATYPQPLYAYRTGRIGYREMILNHKYRRMVFGKYWMTYPVRTAKHMTRSFMAVGLCHALQAIGVLNLYLQRRNRPPAQQDADEFTRVRATVTRKCTCVFGG